MTYPTIAGKHVGTPYYYDIPLHNVRITIQPNTHRCAS